MSRDAQHPPRMPTQQMTIRPLFAWYDLWVGVYWDRAKRRLYILPLPCIGVVVEFKPRGDRSSTRPNGYN